MERYNFKIIEEKWQEYWDKEKTFATKIDNNKKKIYFLENGKCLYTSKNISSNKEDFLLAGWVSSDQYNNEIIFEIEITSTNQMVDDKIFTLPSRG